jgi:two-component system sensor histidine kinase EvgS
MDNQLSGSLPMKVLLAEDNLVSRHLVASFLTERGYDVRVAKDGIEAVALAREAEFDLIVMDLVMPGMNGYAATSTIRQRELGTKHHPPVVALTADDSSDVRERCLASGIDEVLMKPVRASEFFSVIDRLLARNAC